MRFKGTLILLLVFAALGGYVYFTDFYGKEARDKQEEAKKKLFGGDAKEITELTLENGGQTITAVRKGEKDWQITAPAGFEADPEAWDQLATSLVDAQKDEVVTSEKPNLASYGLDKPAVAVRAKLKGGKTEGVLIGLENPKKTFNYAKRVDTDEVFLLPTSSTTPFKKTLTDLRNKKVLDFESDSINGVRITAAGKPDIEIQKSGSDWSIKKPLEARADNGEVLGFLSAIQFSRASAFADEKVDDKAAGLDAPGVKVVDETPGDWDVGKTTRIWESLLERHPNIRAAFFHNDEMALAALRVISKARKQKQVLVGGVDGLVDACAAVARGEMVGTVINPTGRIHSGALWIGYFLATQGERANVPRFIRIDGGMVDKDTAPGYLWLGDHLLI